MSLYINKTNQEILWNTIQRIPTPPCLKNKESWFREIIRHFHDSKGNIIDIVTLKQINRETIEYMIQDLQRIQGQEMQQMQEMQQSIQSQNFTPFSQIQEQEYLGKPAEKAKKQELYNLAFEERQKQFNEMFVKPTIPEVNFAEKLDDEPLKNMEELIEKHRKEREEEMKQFSPPIIPSE